MRGWRFFSLGRWEGPQASGLDARLIFPNTHQLCWAHSPFSSLTDLAVLVIRVCVPGSEEPVSSTYYFWAGFCVCFCSRPPTLPPSFLRNVWLKNSNLVPAELRGRGLWPNVSWRIVGAGAPGDGVWGRLQVTAASDQFVPPGQRQPKR